MRSLMQTRGVNHWSTFASSWDDLGLDVYMADGGRYRRRRFAAFGACRWHRHAQAPPATLPKPRLQHAQRRDRALVHAGVGQNVCQWVYAGHPGRLHDDLRCRLAGSPHTRRLARGNASVPDRGPQGPIGSCPTPEGAHRDGVDWVCVLLVNRCNVSSGVTQIFTPDGRSLGAFTLTEPLDAVFLDDRRVLHGVTPIAPVDPALESIPRRPGAHLSARSASQPRKMSDWRHNAPD